ncbi:MAG: tRNA-specific 2-thiouridylase, partial [Patescibacteria group bacterium]
MNGNNKKVFVMMSGGVDSSVAALLLKQRGYDVVGVFMRCFNLDGCAERDAEDARRVAEKLDIPFYVWDFEKEYKKKVVEYMVEGYKQGITPNPDVMCNKEIKFGLFLEKALAMGADYVASGHYARLSKRKNFIPSTRFGRSSDDLACPRRATAGASLITADQARSAAGVSENKIFSLKIAKDKNKDQSYFLWTLTQKQLKHCLFPIGDYLKSEVREIARKAELPTAEKKDSQGICFLGKVTLDEFLKQYIPEKRGAVLNISGEKLGEHNGAHFYTIGQRHIGIKYQSASRRTSIKDNADTKPYYVAEKDVKTNTLMMAEGNDNLALYKKEIEIINVNFFNPLMLNTKYSIRVMARVRYRQPLASARLDFSEALCYKLTFAKPQKFVAS